MSKQPAFISDNLHPIKPYKQKYCNSSLVKHHVLFAVLKMSKATLKSLGAVTMK